MSTLRPRRSVHAFSTSAALFAAATLPVLRGTAQDLIAVNYSGAIFGIDSASGAATVLAAGLFGQNDLTRDAAGRLWTVSRNLLGTPHYFLTRIDPTTFQSQAVAPCQDLRALADAGGGELFAIEFAGGNGRLVRLDTVSGARTVVGSTGQTIEAMAMHQGVLYAWSTSDGLGTLDPATAAFTDLGPAQGSNEVLWLATQPDGQLAGGAFDVYTFDVATGLGTLRAQGSVLLTGAVASGYVLAYGQGCAGVTLTASGSLRPGSVLTTHSTGYPSTGAVVGEAGALIVGSSRTEYQGMPLPILLDPLFGTNGCSLYASIDSAMLDFTTGGAAPSLFFPILIPAAIVDQTFYMQHAGLSFTGAMQWSNGIQVHIGL